MLLNYYGDLQNDIIEDGTYETQVCLDEVNRGGLFGNVFVCATIWNPTLQDPTGQMEKIKDSKKLTKKKRIELRQYIENNAIDQVTCSIDNNTIDNINILQSTFKAMYECLDIITKRHNIDRILVDGNIFPTYKMIPHVCVPKGDDTYIGIACSSILAKCNHDDWIESMCNQNNELDEKYSLLSNRGYGTKKHIEGIKQHGLTTYHRKSFCKNFT